MAQIQIVKGDLFDSKSNVLLLPYDGMNKKFEGNLISAFKKVYPDWNEVAREVEEVPVNLGHILPVPIYDFRDFKQVILCSTHAHLPGNTGTAAFKSYVSSCVFKSLEWALRNHFSNAASAVMGGGWRLGFIDALYAMAEGVRRAKGNIILIISIPKESDLKDARDIIRQAGF